MINRPEKQLQILEKDLTRIIRIIIFSENVILNIIILQCRGERYQTGLEIKWNPLNTSAEGVAAQH